MRTPLSTELGIEFPLFAFSHCRDVVAAVSRAGGLGVLGALYFTPEELETELRWIDDHVDGKPYGVDVVMPASVSAKVGEASAQDSARDSMEDTLRQYIPDRHREFVESILSKYDVPELPADADPVQMADSPEVIDYNEQSVRAWIEAIRESGTTTEEDLLSAAKISLSQYAPDAEL